MCKSRTQTKLFFAALVMTISLGTAAFAQSPEDPSEASDRTRLKSQTNSMLDRELLVRAEERAEALRAKLLKNQVQELELQGLLDDLDFRLTPEGIRMALAFVGSVRPMDELRYELRLRLEAQKTGVNKLVQLVATSRERLEAAIRDAEAEVDRLRQSLNSNS